MRVVVSGASGFIGTSVVRQLRMAGHQVIAIVAAGSFAGSGTNPGDDPSVIEDPRSTVLLSDAIQRVGAEAAIHLAGRLDPLPDAHEFDAVIEANIGFASRFVGAVGRANPGCRVVVVRSIREFATTRPDVESLYAASKLAFQPVLRYLARSYDLDIVSVVLPWVYGPGQRDSALIPTLARSAVTGQVAGISSPHTEIDLVYVEDAATAVAQCLEPSLAIGEWRVTAGTAISIGEIADRVAAIAGSKVAADWGATESRSVDLVPADLPAVLPGWHPRTELDVGLEDVIASVS
ncbi:NAD-dependent epimerase/dehydratase family protein [Actinomycetota bacterium]